LWCKTSDENITSLEILKSFLQLSWPLSLLPTCVMWLLCIPNCVQACLSSVVLLDEFYLNTKMAKSFTYAEHNLSTYLVGFQRFFQSSFSAQASPVYPFVASFSSASILLWTISRSYLSGWLS